MNLGQHRSGIRRAVSGATELAVGQGANLTLGLVRNWAIARLVSPHDFGVAATFASALAVLQLASDVGVDKLIVQSPSGDGPELQAASQALLAARGLAIGAVVLVCAPLIADLFNVPELAWAYRVLALVPVVRGFIHLDYLRFQRELRYRADVAVTVVPQVLATITAVAAGVLFADYRAMLFAIVVQAFVMLAVTHVVRVRRYRLARLGAHGPQILRFAWPLMLNGMVIVAASQGDRVLIGGALGVTLLGLYAAASTLVRAPNLLILRVSGAIALPMLSSAQRDAQCFSVRYRRIGAVVCCSALLLQCPIAAAGAELVPMVFGDSYQPSVTLIGALALAAGLQLVRGWPTVATLAVGDTKSLLLVNVVRGVGLGAAVAFAAAGLGVEGVAIGMAVGEFAACLVATRRMSLVARIRARGTVSVVIMYAVAVSISAVAAGTLTGSGVVVRALIGAAVAIVAMVGTVICTGVSADLRNLVLRRAK